MHYYFFYKNICAHYFNFWNYFVYFIPFKVNPQSLAQKAGLQPGDALLQIGDNSTEGMAHEQAKMEIIRSGNELDFVVQR